MKYSGACKTGEIDATAEASLTEIVMDQILSLYSRHAIYPSPVQKQMLTSHVSAMASRSVTGEALPTVEKELFEDISAESFRLAQEIVALFGNLPEEEAWLLSVHIEVARNNANSDAS